MSEEKTLASYQTADAIAAAAFVHRCMCHYHRGVLDCEDKFILFGNDGYPNARTKKEVEIVQQSVVASGWERTAFGTHEGSWAIVVYNYQRQPVSLNSMNTLVWDAWRQACKTEGEADSHPQES